MAAENMTNSSPLPKTHTALMGFLCFEEEISLKIHTLLLKIPIAVIENKAYKINAPNDTKFSTGLTNVQNPKCSPKLF